MHHVRNAREIRSAGGLVLDADAGSGVGQCAGYGGVVEVFGLVLGEFEQGGLQVGDLACDRGGVEALAVGDQFYLLGW
jgi:hypothetical protein